VVPPARLRPATASDSEAVAAVWAAGWVDGHRGRVPEALAAARTPESFRSRAAARVEDTVVAVADPGGEIAGFVMVSGDEVEQVYVAAAHRGSGVADLLLAEGERLVAAGGHRRAWLAVVAGNTRARRFYERRGWVDEGPFDYVTAVPGGTVAVPAHRYVKAVGPPPGYHTVTPRIVVGDVAAQVEFLRTVFGATGDVHGDRPAEIRVGDSVLMVSGAGQRDPFPAFLYVYVADADDAYRRALAAGAVSVEEPLDTPYGDRRAMVRDPFGNVFQLAHRLA
jgi:uncharacterized glyoxalase superfamily protein PhnB/GNAT superfamily N-acetyltransferase